MLKDTLTFTGQETSLASLGSFKAHVMHELNLSDVFAMQTPEDWRDLFSETRTALEKFNSVTLYTIDHGIINQAGFADNIDVARGSLKKGKPILTAGIDEIKSAITKLEQDQIGVKARGLIHKATILA